MAKRFDDSKFAAPAPKLLKVEVGKGAGAMTFVFARAGQLERFAISDLYRRMVEKYVAFDMRTVIPSKDAPEPVPFPPIGQKPVIISESACLTFATLTVLQFESDNYDLMEFEDWVRMSIKAPDEMDELLEKIADVMMSAHGELKDDDQGEAHTNTSLEPASASALPITPSS